MQGEARDATTLMMALAPDAATYRYSDDVVYFTRRAQDLPQRPFRL